MQVESTFSTVQQTLSKDNLSYSSVQINKQILNLNILVFFTFEKSPRTSDGSESDWKLLRGIKKRALSFARCRWWSAGAIWRQLLANRRAFLFKMAKALAPLPLSAWIKKRKGCALRLLSRPESSLRQRQVAATAAKTNKGCGGQWEARGGW